jgi:magnesium transporter
MEAFILEGEAVKRTKDADAIQAAFAARTPIWVDLGSRDDATDAFLSETVALHALTIEDIWCDRPDPKVDEFPEYLYVCVHSLAREGDAISPKELDLVIGKTFVVSHDDGVATTLTLRQELLRSPRILERGAPWVAHALLDRLVDAYFPVIDGLDDEIESVEGDVLAYAGTPRGEGVLQHILRLKRSLQALRRTAIHQREVLLRLARGEFAVFPIEVLPYLRDVLDHFVRVADLAESYRDLVTSALDAYLSVQSNRMNAVMKTLTLISTVMLPLTFIAGVYGMNFEHMPELKWSFGYPFALGLMALVAVSAGLWFRFKRWL